MRGCVILLTVALAALAQEVPVASSAQPGTTVPSGVPLRVALERRIAIKRVGEPIQGRLVDPVYVSIGWSFRPEASWKGISLESAEFQPAGASRRSCLAT